ncbi:hypothetical protein MPH_11970 [Macrophomina phaseolina MS6]|uniref:Uncharacterized protein n=2 Tax=Macrophomina phaseolina TaxID=35725 RepID=K2RDF3_MACPH|nr:hypothetical protein MPH_11970 [Macrophomina phaseolina MS6]
MDLASILDGGGENEPTGIDSCYAVYNRFDASKPEEDDQGAEDLATTENDVNNDGSISSEKQHCKTRFPPLISEEELCAPGPGVVPR